MTMMLFTHSKIPLWSILALALSVAHGHTRLECPPPRSGETGVKEGPCDVPNDDLSLAAFPLIPGALNTITWLESIPHPGAPGRLALSLDGNDDADGFESCILLDHIPHDEYSTPTFSDPLTYHRSSITIYIPDIYCERCHLQLMTVMSDDVHGVPANTTCAYPGAQAAGTANVSLPACPVVYHSCAPVSINGTTPRNDITQCNTTEFEERLNWPFTPDAETDENDIYSYSEYFFKGDPGIYNQSDARLLAGGAPLVNCESPSFCDPFVVFQETVSVPANAPYRALEGVCAAMVHMQVEEFALGVLPSTPKNSSTQGWKPPQEASPCTACNPLAQCFREACVLRNAETGNWTGDAVLCNEFAPSCEECYQDSPCYRGVQSSITVNDGGSEETSTTDGQMDENGSGASSSSSSGEISGASEWGGPTSYVGLGCFMLLAAFSL